MKRRGFMLVELLVALAVFTVLAMVLSLLWHDLVRRTPRFWRDANRLIVGRGFWEQLRTDVEAAHTLKLMEGDPNLARDIRLGGPEGLVVYEQRAGAGTVRRTLWRTGKSEQREWDLEGWRWECRLWRRDGEPYALEVQAGLEDALRYPDQLRMANSQVFFVGLAPRQGGQP